MTMKTKQELIAQIAALLNEVIEVEEQAAEVISSPLNPWKCSQSRNAPRRSRVFRNTRYASLWRRRKFRTYAQDRASGEKSLSAARHCWSIWEVRRDEFFKLVQRQIYKRG